MPPRKNKLRKSAPIPSSHAVSSPNVAGGSDLPFPEDSEGPSDPNVVERHPKFYTLDDGVTLKVESYLYRLPRLLLDNSELFRKTLSAHDSRISSEAEGMASDFQITTCGVTKLQMDSLLTILRARLLHGDLPLKPEEWFAALHLSNQWEFLEAKKYAINCIEKLDVDPITRILLARQCNVPVWLKKAYVDLCIRPQALTVEEAEKIGMHTCIALPKLRERVLLQVNPSLGQGLSSCGTCSRRCACGRSPWGGYGNQCSTCWKMCGCASQAHGGASPEDAFTRFPRDKVEPMVDETSDLQN